MFNLQAAKSRSDVLEIKPGRSNRADTTSPGVFNPGFSLQKPGLLTLEVFKLLAQPREQSTTSYQTATP